MFELVDNAPQSAVIKVIGVGGGGGNAVRHMIDHQVDGVDFICANTDAQALSDISSKTVLQLGSGITKGLGAGANPEVGRAAALEDKDRIADALHGADMVFASGAVSLIHLCMRLTNSSHSLFRSSRSNSVLGVIAPHASSMSALYLSLSHLHGSST